MIKTCKNCGQQFEAKTTWQEFHNDACRIDYFRKMKKIEEEQKKQQQKKIHYAFPLDE